MPHGRKEVSFVSFIIFTLCSDSLNLNGSVMIINQSINQSIYSYFWQIARLLSKMVAKTASIVDDGAHNTRWGKIIFEIINSFTPMGADMRPTF